MMIERTFSSHSLFYHEEIELKADVTSVSTNGMLERRKKKKKKKLKNKKDVTSVIEKKQGRIY
jgi:hypothetical protein